MPRSEIGEIIIGGIVVLLISILFTAFYICSGLDNTNKRTLSQQESVLTTILGQEVKSTFIRGDNYNYATSSLWCFTRKRIDLNKSKIVGNYVGQKSKSFVKGFFKGLKTPSKHE